MEGRVVSFWIPMAVDGGDVVVSLPAECLCLFGLLTVHQCGEILLYNETSFHIEVANFESM